jgi:hypothetical protein
MTPERLDQIRTIYRVSRLAAPDAAVTKALEELIRMAEAYLQGPWPESGLTPQMMAQQHLENQYRSQLMDQLRGQGQPSSQQKGFGGAVGLPQQGQSLLPGTAFERFKKALGL